jgi:drug/metabolite transporter (DMT)-like permease
VFGALFCWSFYTVGVRRIGSGINPLQITAITTAAGTPGLILLGLPGVLRQQWSAVSVETWGAMAYSAFLALVVAFVLYNRAVQGIGSGRTALYNCVTPLVAMVIAWLTLGEVPTPVQFLGVALVISGVLVSVASHPSTPRDVPSPAGGAG